MKKYQSRYSPGKEISEIQYICELICEKNAQQTGRELPTKFWELPQWSQFYRSQLRRCSALLNKFSSEAIIKGLNDPKAKKIYSLYAAWLIPIIQSYQDKLDIIRPQKDIPEVGGENFQRKSFKNKKNILEELDGKEED